MKYKIIIVLLLMITFSSCKKFLDLTPDSQISNQNFFRNSSDFESALTGVYGTFRGYFSGSTMLYLGELTTDNAEIQWTSPSVSEMQLDQNAVNPTNSYISSAWRTFLTTISQCNTILNRIDKVDFDVAVKNRIKGEALFLRAYSFFYLTQIFGNVPITTEEFKSPEQILAADLSLQPSEKAYALIIGDLTTAEGLLPATLNPEKTRASLGTVKTLLGKVYLTLHEYDLAAAELKAVIDSHDYSLAPAYKTLFSSGNNNLAESIFEIQFVSGKTIGNNYSYLFSPAITSMAIFQNNQQGAGRIVPTLDIMNAYEAGDARKAASVNDSVPLINGTKTYNRYGLKFVDFKAIDVTDGSITFTVLRYADVLLMYAEALNESDHTPDAFPYINAVRERAQLTDLSGLGKDDLRIALEKERRVEFLDEGQRWFDLLRTGRTEAVLNAYYNSTSQHFSVEDYELIFPIPQNEVDLNAAVIQNPGY